MSSLAQGPLSSPALRNHAVVETLRRRLAFGFLPSAPRAQSSAASPNRRATWAGPTAVKDGAESGNSPAQALPTITPQSSPEGPRPITETDVGSRRAAASAALATARAVEARAARGESVQHPVLESDPTAEPAEAQAGDAWVIRPPLKVTPRRRPPAPPSRRMPGADAGSSEEDEQHGFGEGSGEGSGEGAASARAAVRRPRAVRQRFAAKPTAEEKLAAAYSAKMMAIARSRRTASPPHFHAEAT